MRRITRRRFVGLAALAGVGAIGSSARSAETPAPSAAPAPAPVPVPVPIPAPDAAAAETLPPLPSTFPTQAPEMVREMVAVSHGRIARVQELLALHPTLANAAWDWGFGDWETALGAASHMGNVAIAQVLLEHGARPTIFSATMLGQLAVVKAFVEASPGIQGTLGPHGITLLGHARAGAIAAKPVREYLEALGGADPIPKSVELAPEILAKYAGVYAFGAGETDRVEIKIENGMAHFTRVGGSPRNMLALGEDAFHPVGAPAVRVRFVVTGETVTELTVYDPGLVLRARRVG